MKSTSFCLTMLLAALAFSPVARAVEQWDENGELVEPQPGDDQQEYFLGPEDDAAPYDQPGGEDYRSGQAAPGNGQPPPPPQEEGYLYVEEEDPGAQPPGQEVNDTGYFFDSLAPYGEWIWTPEYGWVWQPRGTWADWRPYSYGRWAYTEYGWTWVSYFPWGWAPFHYGSWAVLSPFGWVWVPGTTWAPAWVIWRYSDAYIGWSPILAGYGLWFGWGFYPVIYDNWIFISWNHFCDPHPQHHYVPRRQVARVFRRTAYPRGCRDRGGPGCIRGPVSHFVARKTGRTITPLKVQNVAGRLRAGQRLPARALGIKGKTLRIFRPRLAPGRSFSPATAGAGRRSVDLGTVPARRRPRVRTTPARHPTAPGPGITPSRRPTPGKTIFPRPPRTPRPAPRLPAQRVRPTRRVTPGQVRPRPVYRAPAPVQPGSYSTPPAKKYKNSSSNSRSGKSTPSLKSRPAFRSRPSAPVRTHSSPSRSRRRR